MSQVNDCNRVPNVSKEVDWKNNPNVATFLINDKERVNHPDYYKHPSGVECIEVARHHDFNIGNAIKYLWRAGRKSEIGMTDLQKQIEDLEKAVFYINDEIALLATKQQELWTKS